MLIATRKTYLSLFFNRCPIPSTYYVDLTSSTKILKWQTKSSFNSEGCIVFSNELRLLNIILLALFLPNWPEQVHKPVEHKHSSSCTMHDESERTCCDLARARCTEPDQGARTTKSGIGFSSTPRLRQGTFHCKKRATRYFCFFTFWAGVWKNRLTAGANDRRNRCKFEHH